MKFTLLADMDGNTLLMVYVLAIAVGWAIFYYTIKAAVKWGMIEAKEHINQKPITTKEPTKLPNPAQQKLQEKYDKGEIKFEEFQTEWNKLI